MQRKEIIINGMKHTAINAALEAKAVFTDPSIENYQISRSVPLTIGTLLFFDNITGSGSTLTNTIGFMAMVGFTYAAANEYGLNNTVNSLRNYASSIYGLFASQQPKAEEGVYEKAVSDALDEAQQEKFHDTEESDSEAKFKKQ